MTDFTMTIDLNGHLPEGGGDVDAILTVASSGLPSSPVVPGLEILIIDCSASMTGERIKAARAATITAIKQLSDGVHFAVVAGNHRAWGIYPDTGVAIASPATRRLAVKRVGRLEAAGSTAMSTWLELAAEIADGHERSGHRHAIMLTDGYNEEPEERLPTVLHEVGDRLTVDCRGIGADWSPDQLRIIASQLLGTADIVADPQSLADDFRALMTASMGKTNPNLTLRVWNPRGARVSFVKQVAPTIDDLTGRRVDVDELHGDYPIGSWGCETRDYHLRVQIEPRAAGIRALAARAEIRNGDAVLARGLVEVAWTDDPVLSTRINPRVAHYTGQAELAVAIQEGLAARRAGDVRTATARLGRAVALATASGHESTAKLLANVVEVVDAPSGTIRLRGGVSAVDELALNIRSTKTVRTAFPS